MFYPKKCIGCGSCYGVCPAQALGVTENQRVYLEGKCQRCGICARACNAEAIVIRGKTMGVGQVMDEIDSDRYYYVSSGGGVTFSGGEPLLQAEFLMALLIACKARGYHTAVDTAGNVPWYIFEKIIPYVDLWLYDIKVYDPDMHIKATGSDNSLILANLTKLSMAIKGIIVRIPMIPGVNTGHDEAGAIAGFLSGMEGIRRVDLLQLNHMAEGKYESLRLDYRAIGLAPPGLEKIRAISGLFEEKGLDVIIS